MKVLVTGCMGFIGSSLVPELLQDGYEVIGVDNLFNPSIRPTDRMKAEAEDAWKHFNFFKGDIRDHAFLSNVFLNFTPEIVVNLAAVGSVPRSFANPNATMDVNVGGFTKLLQTMALHKCKRLVYASSSSVYGDVKGVLRNEGLEGRCTSPYAISKRMNEDFARVWGNRAGLTSIGLRFFNVYGPGQRHDIDHAAVIPRFINDEIPRVNGDGNTTRDFTFVRDVTRAIRKSILHTANPLAQHSVFNIGTGHGTSLNRLLEILGKTADTCPTRVGDVDYSVAGTALARMTLEWEARVRIEDGLKETEAFYSQERALTNERQAEA